MSFTYSKLAETTVGAGGASAINFNNIPQNYTDLVIKASIRGLNTQVYQFASITFNGSATGYSGKRVEGSGSSASSYNGASTGVDLNFGTGSTATTNTFGNAEVYIPNYTAAVNKSVSSDIVGENNATTAYSVLAADLWANPTAITSIRITGINFNFVQYSTATLYGVRIEL